MVLMYSHWDNSKTNSVMKALFGMGSPLYNDYTNRTIFNPTILFEKYSVKIDGEAENMSVYYIKQAHKLPLITTMETC